jgi:hypothetical protein
VDDIELVTNKIAHVERKVVRLPEVEDERVTPPHESYQLEREQSGCVRFRCSRGQICSYFDICDGLFFSAVRVLHGDRSPE